MGLDRDGQPAPHFNSARRAARSSDELLGICKGIIADGRVCESEAEFLVRWFQENLDARTEWPASVIYDRIARAYVDGRFSGEELEEIQEVIKATVGTRAPGVVNAATDLPLTPVEKIEIWGSSFCFTGKFYFGTRKDCETAVSEQGGEPRGNIVNDLNYLVVGSMGSRDWKHSTHGTKILKAVELRQAGYPLNIVSEELWAKFL